MKKVTLFSILWVASTIQAVTIDFAGIKNNLDQAQQEMSKLLQEARTNMGNTNVRKQLNQKFHEIYERLEKAFPEHLAKAEAYSDELKHEYETTTLQNWQQAVRHIEGFKKYFNTPETMIKLIPDGEAGKLMDEPLLENWRRKLHALSHKWQERFAEWRNTYRNIYGTPESPAKDR